MSEAGASSSSDEDQVDVEAQEPKSLISGITEITSYDKEPEFKEKIKESPKSAAILEEVMARMKVKMELLAESGIKFQKPTKTNAVDEKDWEKFYDAGWTSDYSDSTGNLLTTLKHICWSMMNNTKLCLANNQKLASMGDFGFDLPRLERIILQLSLIEQDLDDFALSAVPVVHKLSSIRKLINLINHLTGRYGETVSINEVKDQINGQKLMSHYEGFVFYRHEDLESLELYKTRLQTNVERWNFMFPFIRSFCEQTEYLSETADRWDNVEIPVSELSECNTHLRDIIARAEKLLYLIKAVLRHAEGTLGGYIYYRRTLQTNLSDFLIFDIFNLFLKEVQS